MAKDVITRFKLETTAFDSKIKQAAKGLSDYSKTATNAGKDFDKFTKSNVEAARALGTMATSSNNAKGKVQELVGAYNELVKTYEHLTNDQKQSDFAKAMAESMTILQQRIKDTKQELYGLGEAAEQVKSKGSGLFGEGGFTGMLAVTGGNLLASGIQKLGAEMADTIQQSIELARQGEGVRLAFERLNKPGLLDNLKEATHGTVSELELMKAAVKFEDFKLPVEQLGTLLAFAQKKAKDTGQSVDYMVDSIVTGLGRKSLMILDNLGLSAAQIKEEMAKTGDMTSAVAKIIKEQMAEAGEYVETAADRAARAAADATNEMERLGREAQPFAEAWAGTWNEIKIGGMDLLTTVFGPLAESARQIRNILNGGGFKFKAGISNLAEGPAPSPSRQPGTDHKVNAKGGYVVVTDTNTGAVIGGQHFDNLQDTNGINTWKKTLFKTGGGKNGKNTNKPTYAADSIMAQEKLVAKLTDQYKRAGAAVKDGIKKQLDEAKKTLDEMNGKVEKIDLNKIFPDVGVSGGVSQSFGQQLTQSINVALAEAAQDADVQTLKTMLETTIKNGIEGVDIPADWLGEQIFGEGVNIPDEYWKNLQEQINEKLREMGLDELNIDFRTGDNKGKDKDKKDKKDKSVLDDSKKIVSGLNQVASGLNQMGIQLPKEIQDVLGFLNGLMSVIEGIQTIIGVFQVGAITANTAALIANTAALAVNTAVPSVLANGGVVHAAGGWSGFVPGNNYSGDMVPAMLNSGELVLNRAQQGNLASQLNGGGMQNIQLEAVISGEQIMLASNNRGRRTGRGEIVQSRRVK